MIAKRHPLRRAPPRFVTETQRGLHTTCALGGAGKQGARSRRGERATAQLRAAAPASLSPRRAAVPLGVAVARKTVAPSPHTFLQRERAKRCRNRAVLASIRIRRAGDHHEERWRTHLLLVGALHRQCADSIFPSMPFLTKVGATSSCCAARSIFRQVGTNQPSRRAPTRPCFTPPARTVRRALRGCGRRACDRCGLYAPSRCREPRTAFR